MAFKKGENPFAGKGKGIAPGKGSAKASQFTPNKAGKMTCPSCGAKGQMSGSKCVKCGAKVK